MGMSTAFSTTLFVPFHLRENAEGDYLKKGFVIDEVLNEHFPIKREKYISFLKIGQFNSRILPQALLRVINPKFKDYKAIDSYSKDFFNECSIVDKKYLNIINGFYDLHRGTSPETGDSYDLINKLSNSFQISNLIFDSIDAEKKFKLGEINLIINRPFNVAGLAYGFVSVNLDWIVDDQNLNDFSNFTKIGRFLRYFDNDSQNVNKIRLYRNQNQILNGNVMNSLIDYEEKQCSLDFSKYKLDNTDEVPVFSLRALVDELLKLFIRTDDLNKYLYFEHDLEEKIKPTILHLIGTNSGFSNLANFEKNVFQLLRIPEESIDLNNDTDFKPLKEDYKSLKYFLSEGAVIVETQRDPSFANKALEKKYYMAFLFAMNQRLLFHYFQKKINELEIESNGYFIPRELRRLKGTLLKGDFAQVFSSISNYHEIDSFYENLRKTFKIIQLREEFITSVESIEKIASLAEEKERRRKEEKQKLFEERKYREKIESEQEIKDKLETEHKRQSDKLNEILLILTIAQVVSAIFSAIVGICSAESSSVLIVFLSNLVLFLLLGIIGTYLYFFRNIKSKELNLEIPDYETIQINGATFTLGENNSKLLDSSKMHSLSIEDQKKYLFEINDENSTTITIKSFRIGIYPVTQGLYNTIMNKMPSRKSSNLPVTNLSWVEVKEFIAKLNKKRNLNYRLPSEAEWEFAAKGGKNSNQYLYAGSDDIYDVAWFKGNSFGKVRDVGQKIPNELGLYGMSGNVWEWCEDSYSEKHGEKVVGSSKVLKGGSCNDDMEFCRISNRYSKDKDYKDEFIGFRLVEDVVE
jgi:formylglycine-generating enzyme required for sulfatase activity